MISLHMPLSARLNSLNKQSSAPQLPIRIAALHLFLCTIIERRNRHPSHLHGLFTHPPLFHNRQSNHYSMFANVDTPPDALQTNAAKKIHAFHPTAQWQ